MNGGLTETWSRERRRIHGLMLVDIGDLRDIHITYQQGIGHEGLVLALLLNCDCSLWRKNVWDK